MTIYIVGMLLDQGLNVSDCEFFTDKDKAVACYRHMVQKHRYAFIVMREKETDTYTTGES